MLPNFRLVRGTTFAAYVNSFSVCCTGTLLNADMIHDCLFYHYGAEIPIEEILFSMAIENDLMTIFGKYCHIWKTALLSLLSEMLVDPVLVK